MKINAALEQAEHCALGAGIRGCGVSSPGGAAAAAARDWVTAFSFKQSDLSQWRRYDLTAACRWQCHAPTAVFTGAR